MRLAAAALLLLGCRAQPATPAASASVEQAHRDACAALGWVVDIDLCEVVPAVPQLGTGWPSVAFWDGRGPRLLYDREQMASAMAAYGYGAVAGVFGHELGHVIDVARGDVDPANPTMQAELSADAWAGCAVAILDHPHAGLQRLLRDLHEDDATIADARVAAVEDGKRACRIASPETM